jgi:hypothetical protein
VQLSKDESVSKVSEGVQWRWWSLGAGGGVNEGGVLSESMLGLWGAVPTSFSSYRGGSEGLVGGGTATGASSWSRVADGWQTGLVGAGSSGEVEGGEECDRARGQAARWGRGAR